MSVNLKSLISKLNDTSRRALESAAGLCVARTHYNVEIEHFVMRLLENTEDDSSRIFHHFGIDPSRLHGDLNRALDKLKRGNARTPAFSESLVLMFDEAWTLGSLEFGATSIRSGHTLLALTQNAGLWRMIRESSREIGRIDPVQLKNMFGQIVAGSEEEAGGGAEAAEEGPAGEGPAIPRPSGKTPNLDQFTVDLTAHAKAGKVDPVLGRDAEVRQIVDILMRRRQNNPILTGEAGVGKTAVVEGFARRVADGDVPPPLQNVTVRSLDLALLQAGAGVKGEFENRLKGLIEEVKSSPTPIILFIDEAHTMIGAGGSAGQGDAANLLKPALARGELRTIAATTWAEYKKYFEKDAALARRFQVVKVEEPSEDVAVRMMRGLTDILEKHHKVRILEEAVESAVKLSHRYIPARQLPDKSVSLLDTACARVAIGQNAVPPAVENARRQIEHLQVEIDILEREQATGAGNQEKINELRHDLEQTRKQLGELESRWNDEKKRVEEIRELSTKIEARYKEERAKQGGDGQPFEPSTELAGWQADLASKAAELRKLQAETPLLQVSVDAQTIAEVVAGWTGIPVGKMMANEIQTVLNLRSKLEERVIGQSHALEAISQRIRTARASLTDPRRPIGVFLLVGSSGVGKTETALALADTLYGGERNLITINMSEYQESHTVSGLKGSPPGYVGYGEGGVLTEAVRRRPYSVVLLDEVEKAHPDVLELFFQVFDKGTLEDGEGREIDFKNTIILLTSNVGTETIINLCKDPDTTPAPEVLAESVRPDLLAAKTERGVQVFKQAFLGRLIVVPYYPISDLVMRQIIKLQLGRVAGRMRENHNATLSYGDELIDCIAGRCREVETGARNVDHILTRTLLPEISQEVLSRMAESRPISRVHVSVDDKGGFAYAID